MEDDVQDGLRLQVPWLMGCLRLQHAILRAVIAGNVSRVDPAADVPLQILVLLIMLCIPICEA